MTAGHARQPQQSAAAWRSADIASTSEWLVEFTEEETRGERRLASSAAVYNEILERRPDVLDVLYEPFAFANGMPHRGQRH